MKIFGKVSTLEIVTPVVVNPLVASKILCVKLYCPLKINGNAVSIMAAIQVRKTMMTS